MPSGAGAADLLQLTHCGDAGAEGHWLLLDHHRGAGLLGGLRTTAQ